MFGDIDAGRGEFRFLRRHGKIAARDELAARAARQGMSMQEYLYDELTRLAPLLPRRSQPSWPTTEQRA